MKAKKIQSLVLACLLLISVFAACGNSGSSTSTAGSTEESGTAETEKDTSTSSGSKKLTIWVYGWETASAEKIMEDAETWYDETGVEIEVISVASDSYNTKMQATLAGGDNPDLAFIDAGVLSMQLAAKDVLLGLSDYGVNDYKDLFYESVWDTMVYKDEVYGLRITSNNLALYYNKELFDNAGLEYPTADWTWDDLRNAAKTLTDKENGVYGLDLPVYDESGGYCWTWLPFLWQNGGQLLNEDRTEAIVNSAEGVGALEYWRALVDDGSVPLSAAASGVNRFSSGITAMMIDGPWSLSTYIEDPNFVDKLGVAPLPQNTAQATVVGGEGVVIFSNTDYPQEAYDYLTHLCCSDFTEVFWENWITVPPQEGHEDFYADLDVYGEYISVFTSQMEYSQTRQFTPSWTQIEDAMALNLEAYMFGEEDDAQAALDAAVEDINKILAEEAEEYGD